MKNSLCLSVWLHPRASVRSAIKNKSMNLAIYLYVLTGMVVSLYLFFPTSSIAKFIGTNIPVSQQLDADMSLLSMVIIIVLIGVMIGVISWFVSAGIILAIGKIFKKLASLYEILIALGIALIPISTANIIWGFNIIFLGKKLFVLGFESTWLLFSHVATVVLAIWSFILMIIAIVEVHLKRF